MTALLLLGGLLLLLLLALIGLVATGRCVVRQREVVEQSWRQVAGELSRRHELVSDLVRTVTTYAGHERTVLNEVVGARDRAARVGMSVRAQAAAETALARSLRGLLAVAEAYPDLLADGPFRQLQVQLVAIEDRIAAGRRHYNDAAQALNDRVEGFTSGLGAFLLSVRAADYFEPAEPQVLAPVGVSFQVPPTA